MTTFDERFAARGAPRLLSEFGETVIYKPAGGAPRTITAMVTRNPPQEVTEGARTFFLIVEVYNDATTGILGKNITTMQDKISVADVVGRKPRDKTIQQILDDSGGMVRLQVQ